MAKVKVDFRETEERGGKKRAGGRKHYPEGDYPAKCIKAEIIKSAEKETPGISLTWKFTQGKLKGQMIRDDLWLTPKSMWRVRVVLEAVGKKVPSKVINLDTSTFVGGEAALTLVDEEYDNKSYSKVDDVFSLTEYEQLETDSDEELDEDEETEEETEEEENLEEVDLDEI